MEKFWESYKTGALLPKGEYFGALVKTHHKQALGLFNFFFHAKDWLTFLHNACWARVHVNEGMFVYALTLAVIHRDDFRGLMLPMIYEIFPQNFFNSEFVHEAKKFDYNTWSKYIMYEKEFQDVYYRSDKFQKFGNYVYMKDWKKWQWWKLMGLDERWYSDSFDMLRENTYTYKQDEKWSTMLKDLKVWWHPVDYSRDIDFYNDYSSLAYLTEDVGWNSYWYYLNMDYSISLGGDSFGLNKDRRGEFWIYNTHKLMTRYYMERLSHGFGDIPEYSWMSILEQGYNPQLISYNGVGYSYRPNYYDFKTFANVDMLDRIHTAFHRIYQVIDTGIYQLQDGSVIDLRHPKAIDHIGNLLQSNNDVFDKYFFNYYYLLSHMYVSHVDYEDFIVTPHVLLNFETMMRDPLFYMFHKKIARVFFHFKDYLEPYTREELLLPGVEIKDVHVDELITYFDLVDTDVTNLLSEKMAFVDGKFVWDKTLLARQMRLNHKPFDITLTIESDRAQKVMIQSYLAPKYDELGRTVSMADHRENVFSLDKFIVDLSSGMNVIKRSSDDFIWTIKDRTTYTELYHYVMMAFNGEYDLSLDISPPHCLFPDRLLLPRGWEEGMPMTMFFMAMPYEPSQDQLHFDITYYCGIGSGRHPNSKPYAYPFDRKIDEYEFVVPNMYFKDVKIYHYDNFNAYLESSYENYGKFDYSFFDDYYTNAMKH